MKRTLLAPLLLVIACAHGRLEDAGDKIIRVERGTAAVVDGVIRFKDTVKADCVAQKLETEAERARCIEPAMKALDVSEASVLGVKAAMVSFWELYAVLEGKLVSGDRLNQADLVEVAARSARVVQAYAELVAAVEEARR